VLRKAGTDCKRRKDCIKILVSDTRKYSDNRDAALRAGYRPYECGLEQRFQSY
jgi:hypothetical protein